MFFSNSSMAMMDRNENMGELLVGTWNPKNAQLDARPTGLVVMESGKKTGPKKDRRNCRWNVYDETEAKGKKQQKNHPDGHFLLFLPARIYCTTLNFPPSSLIHNLVNKKKEQQPEKNYKKKGTKGIDFSPRDNFFLFFLLSRYSFSHSHKIKPTPQQTHQPNNSGHTQLSLLHYI